MSGNDPDDFLIGNRCRQPVAVGASCQVGVRLDPQASGIRSASLTLITNAPRRPPAIALSTGTTRRSGSSRAERKSTGERARGHRPVAGAVGKATTTKTVMFTEAGGYPFTVPAGVTGISVHAVGGTGGECVDSPPPNGGAGAAVTATVPVSPGEPLRVGVASRGSDCARGGAGGIGGGGEGGRGSGGGLSNGAGGGGASLIGVASPSPGFAGPLVIAGGGGGAGFLGDGGPSGSPGKGYVGASGKPGGAGTPTSGGAGGGSDGQPNHHPGAPGSYGLGGIGGSCAESGAAGGGGGGGYYGGGGGGCGIDGGGGGDGGPSFFVPGATNTSAVLTEDAPMVSLTYAVPTADVTPSALRFAAQAPGTAGPAQTVTVTNKGAAPLVVDGVGLAGADPDDFLIFDRCQQPVAVGSSCEVGVRFAP